MKYLDYINSFWKQHEEEEFTAFETQLYFYLLHRANRNFWVSSFSVSTNLVCVELKMSRPTFTKVRNKLKQKGLIDFMEGKRGYKPQYKFLFVNKCVNLINKSGDISGDILGDHDIGKDIRQKIEDEDFFLKKYKNKFLSKKSENNFSEKNFSKPNPGKKSDEVFFQSVNGEEEKRKKVAPKKEKRFVAVAEDVVSSSVNSPTGEWVRSENLQNANKGVLNDDFSSSDIITPEKDENTSNQTKTPLKFIPPSVQEVADYCKERNKGISAEKFVDFYTAKGWMIGKNKMKDWKACVRTWELNQKNDVKKEPTIGRTPLSVIRKNLSGW